MVRFLSRISASLGLSYPEEYMTRIHRLKAMAENEIDMAVEEILTTPQRIVGYAESMLLADAIKEAVREGRGSLEVVAPLLTFPRATPEQWNGTIDHFDTITGTYVLYMGEPFATQHGEHLFKKFAGGPKIVPALKRALGSDYNVTMSIDAYRSPASRFIIILPTTLTV